MWAKRLADLLAHLKRAAWTLVSIVGALLTIVVLIRGTLDPTWLDQTALGQWLEHLRGLVPRG